MLSEPIAATPATLQALAATAPHDFPLLLDSAAEGALSRWSMLAALPGATIRLRGDGQLECQGVSPVGGFLDTLDAAWRSEQSASPTQPEGDRPPFRGGWVVFLGYEIAREIESGLTLPGLAGDATVAHAIRIPALLAFDHQTQRAWLIAEDAAAPGLARLREQIRSVSHAQQLAAPASLPELQEDDPDSFLAAVRMAREHIAAGDIYQANLSRAWRTTVPTSYDGRALYAALRRANPSPFAAWLQTEHLQLLSSSPERLVRSRGKKVDTRPIAGTRPRRVDGGGSAIEIAGLLASAKERAEHTMLIDLERNDLGRVCMGGTVAVDEWMVTESYAHVHHIVSNVSGQLRPDVSPVDVLRALFPGGTITGVPKYRCMQLIAELEGVARGPYTGSLGYINLDGDLDFNILIRTISIADGILSLRAGAGIVADSDPAQELNETRAKARGLLRALGVA